MGLARKAVTRHTYGDYLAWDDDARREIIRGEVFAMTPAPSRMHQAILGNLFSEFKARQPEGPCSIFFAPFDVRLPEPGESDEETATVVQPDLVVVCDPGKLDDRGCRGAPDLVAEVLSPATAARDNIQKLALYEQHGVREYWLVHPTDRIATVYQLDATDRYGKPAVYAAQDVVQVAALPGVAIDLSRVFREPS